MSEFEMAYLQNDMMLALGSATQFFFGMLSAFLVASYIAAHKLTRPMMIVVVCLFVAAALSSIGAIYRQMESLAGLVAQVKAFAVAGNGLQWHMATQVPQWWIESIRYVAVLLFLAAMVGSVYFFFHCRRVNNKAEIGAWKPKV